MTRSKKRNNKPFVSFLVQGEPVTLRAKREVARVERKKQDKEGVTFGDYVTMTFVPQAAIEKPRETKQKEAHYRDWIDLTQRYSHLSNERLSDDVKEFEKAIKQARRANVVALKR